MGTSVLPNIDKVLGYEDAKASQIPTLASTAALEAEAEEAEAVLATTVEEGGGGSEEFVVIERQSAIEAMAFYIAEVLMKHPQARGPQCYNLMRSSPSTSFGFPPWRALIIQFVSEDFESHTKLAPPTPKLLTSSIGPAPLQACSLPPRKLQEAIVVAVHSMRASKCDKS